MFKKFFCKHTFQEVSSYTYDSDKGVGYALEKVHIVYCPKCKKEMDLIEHRFVALMGKQALDEMYEKLKINIK